MTQRETIFDGPYPEARAALLNDAFSTIDTDQTFSGMYAAYAQHPWGVHHAGQPLRYSQNYDYGRTEMLQDLGNDLHPVGHMRVTHDHVVALGSATLGRRNALDISDPREIEVVRGSALTHDCGEPTHPDLIKLCGRVIGDMVSGTKTPADRAQERLILGTVLQEVHGELPADYLRRLLDVSTHQPHEEDSPAHRWLDAAHDWGFYAIGLRAGRLALSARDEAPNERTILQGSLAYTVTKVIRPRLEKAMSDFPIIEKRLELAEHTHERIATLLSV